MQIQLHSAELKAKSGEQRVFPQRQEQVLESKTRLGAHASGFWHLAGFLHVEHPF